ncbi:MAG: hypothetical protein J6X65_06695 [Bacteroidales bacterium]|nr:hypothetical protein [Bacteroidales bacterium]
MGTHYLIIIAIVATIVIIQFSIFLKTKKKIRILASIFAPQSEQYHSKRDLVKSWEQTIDMASEPDLKRMLVREVLFEADFMKKVTISRVVDGVSVEEEVEVFSLEDARRALKERIYVTDSIASDHHNSVLDAIFRAINSYLSNNKGNISDFALMKDIVDRNCDSVEEEINTQIPVPLYLGLMGTMGGILVGIGYLWASGDLNALLNAGSEASGTTGVEALLGGVALAMISSIWGILLTTTASMSAKNAKAKCENTKHIFLSWIQANLLPTLSNDTAQEIEKMSQNLAAFNQTFSSNTADLRDTLSQVNQTTAMQQQLLEAVGKINERDLTQQNLEMFTALKKNTGEIEQLCTYLHHSSEYLRAVKELNERLDHDNERARAIENMLHYFQEETRQIEQRKEVMSQAVGKVDSRLEEQLRKLTEHAENNIENFNKALGKQQDALEKKLNQTEVLISEIQHLSAIKEGISKFEKATKEQSQKIDNLTRSIEKLAEIKSVGATHIHKTINWKRLLIWLVPTVVAAFMIFTLLILLLIANWDTFYYNFISKFAF